ncbi:oligosaccharide flippase family protein [Smaragdicoccus niigatensis]|uniref:oligosaccharide flippase family protein n=1 Tax=Smaragdicoccus niigatensis TaxID=359359 RepID=UPI00138B008D|nr:oligosaccharide flippase family protein [Smaragdicoccus niigatensis]
MTAGHLDLKVGRFTFGPAIIVQFTGAVAAYGSQIVLARWLGVAQFGTFSALFAIATISGLIATFGLTGAASRFVPVALRDDDLAAARRYSGAALFGCIVGGAVVGTITGCATLVIYRTSIPTAVLLALLVIAIAVVNFGSDVGRAAGRNISTYGASITLRPAVLIAAVTVAGLAGWVADVPRALALSVAAALIVVVVQLVSLSSAIGVAAVVPRVPTGAWARRAPMWLLFSALGLIATQIDLLVVVAVLPPHEAGIYAAVSKLALAVAIASVAINTVLAPKVASASDGQREEMGALVRTAGRRVLLVGTLVAAPFILTPVLVLSAFGPEFTVGWPELVIMALGQVAVLAFGQGGTVLVYQDREHIAVLCTLIGAIAVGLGALVGAWTGGLLFAAIGRSLAVMAAALLTALAAKKLAGVRPFTW